MAYNFSWIVPEQVGGMALPRREDLVWLHQRKGVTALLSLTPQPPDAPGDIEVCHIPLADMTRPTLDELDRAVRFMRKAVADGGRVVAHCMAGLGRTGTALAGYLVCDGMPSGQAIALVRALRPGSIETQPQEDVIHQYADLVGTPRS